ncbi:MAG: hypothetical protein HY822_19095 [Acidobacteria bacterium]|nr:hypothetical protein [Acidobacteriota bacterium]
MRQKLSEAQVLEDLLKREMGENLQLVDPPSLPRETASRRQGFMFGGAVAGLLAGLAVVFARKLRRGKTPDPEAGS